MTKPFNPLDMDNLGVSLINALLEAAPTPLGDIKRFEGGGVYAVYYTGDFPAYSAIAEKKRNDRYELPIYVGRAIPGSTRKGGTSTGRSYKLHSRLSNHRRSIDAATNLNAEDFATRWLVTEPIWIPLAESILITRTTPVWNSIVSGFGSNAAGSGREAGMRSRWDTLHPGRPEADKLSVRPETATAICQEVEEFLRQRHQV